jgi:hypothetical protein
MHHVMNTCDGGGSRFLHLNVGCHSEMKMQLYVPGALLPMAELPVSNV